MAEEQTAGRGQLDSTWMSQAGKNLTFSLIIYPSFLNLSKQFVLNKVISLSVRALLNAETEISCKVKWPNDIICPMGKLSGILIENNVQGTELKTSVIGIGINLNQEVFGESAGSAVSLYNVTGNRYKKEEMLIRFLRIFETYYAALKIKGLEIFDSEYLDALEGYREERVFEASGTVFRGTITGLSQKGELEVLTSEGIRHFWFKEIKQI